MHYQDVGEDAVDRAVEQGVQHPTLMCKVRWIEYSFENRVGDVYMPPLNCVHMPACIRLFTNIDPDVQEIRTHAGNGLDTCYERNGGGTWQARVPL